MNPVDELRKLEYEQTRNMDKNGKLRALMHQHTTASNSIEGTLSRKGIKHDCKVTPERLLESAYQIGADVIFLTDHNTVKGYYNLVQLRDAKEKYKGITIVKSEEITSNTRSKAHFGAFGINEEISPKKTPDEIVDKIKDQDAVSAAMHAYSPSNGSRKEAVKCDMIEVFNANCVDRHSNMKQLKVARENGKTEFGGSDSHLDDTIGLCTNLIESENNTDSIVSALKKKKIEIEKVGYASHLNMLEHAHYILSNSKEALLEWTERKHKPVYKLAKGILLDFMKNPYSGRYKKLAALGLYVASVASQKANIEGKDFDKLLVDREPGYLLRNVFPEMVLEGFSRVIGESRYQKSLRESDEQFKKQLFGNGKFEYTKKPIKV